MKSIITDELSDELVAKQNELARREVPILIVVESGSGRVNSRIVNEISRALEPRFISYHGVDAEAKGVSAVAQLLASTPAKGEIVLMDRSWYALIAQHFSGGSMEDAAARANAFEEYLLDNGTRIIKIYLQVDPGKGEKVVEEYRPYTALTGSFLSENKIDRVKYTEVMRELIPLTDNGRCHWDIVHVGDIEKTVNSVVKAIMKRFKETLDDDGWGRPRKHKIRECYPNPREDVVLFNECRKYTSKMEELSEELERLQVLLSLSDRSLVLCFEGWDAAGKGGCIKHLAHALNPRGYAVDRVKKPSTEEYAHTHLWRFAKWLPAPGHISVFDRTWYGRMMVEPIEGFCTEEEYQRSADEINAFEKMLASSGCIVLKFWLEVSREEQNRRFEERKTDPLKSWKFTAEDQRNADKWDIYPEYIDRMIASTNTPEAPWFAVGSDNKKSAQLFVMETVVETLRKVFRDV